jgi:hypothetical protein
MTPIVLSSTFAQRAPGEHQGFEYGRSGNPTRRALEACVAALEGGRHGFAFSSGLGAETTLLTLLRTGDHVLSGDDVYGGTFPLLDKVMGPLGISSSFVDLSDLGRVRDAFRPNTRMSGSRRPPTPCSRSSTSRPSPRQGPRRARRRRQHVRHARASEPAGARRDGVVHSTTKYLNGHSDVMGGAVVTSDAELAERLGFQQNAIGAVPSPSTATWCCAESRRSACACASRARRRAHRRQALATPAGEQGHLPGPRQPPGHALAAQQMKAPGGMISFVSKGGLPLRHLPQAPGDLRLRREPRRRRVARRAPGDHDPRQHPRGPAPRARASTTGSCGSRSGSRPPTTSGRHRASPQARGGLTPQGVMTQRTLPRRLAVG